jgi:REP element-mobilizing transposase RayT
MKKYNVCPGEPVRLSIEDEIELAKIFSEIVKRKKLQIIAYNSCTDHIHYIIHYPINLIEDIVKVFKTKSSIAYKTKSNKILWAQKFNREVIDTQEGLYNAINYVRYNRVKHGLSESDELKQIIEEFITPLESF